MLAAAIVGPKKSGKTALLSLIAEALEQRGKRVAVVKYASHPIETGNSDSFWLMRGNRSVASVSAGETVMFWQEQLPFDAIVRRMDADVLLVEGGEPPLSVPRVICIPEEAEELEAFLEETGPVTVIATQGDGESPCGAPHFPEIEPAAAEKIAALILEKGALV